MTYNLVQLSASLPKDIPTMIATLNAVRSARGLRLGERWWPAASDLV